YHYMTRDQRIDSFLAFAESYPDSPFQQDALDKIFELSAPNNTVTELHNFIKSFPDNPNVDEAWKRIYKASVRSITPESLARVALHLPDYPPLAEIQKTFNLTVTNFYPIELNGQCRFVNEHGEIAISPQYEWVEPFTEGLAMVGKKALVGFI